MADRRVADRREKEKGVISFKIKDVIGYVILILLLIVSLIMNIVLVQKNNDYQIELTDAYDQIYDLQSDYDDWDYDEDDDYYDEDEEDYDADAEIYSDDEDEEIIEENDID